MAFIKIYARDRHQKKIVLLCIFTPKAKLRSWEDIAYERLQQKRAPHNSISTYLYDLKLRKLL